MPVYENERGSYIFNSKDLCMIEHIRELIEAGIDSFKIEGRMKTALYVATVARTYRRAIDAAMASENEYRNLLPWCREEISKCTYREYTTGFFFGKADDSAQIYDESTYIKEWIFLGIYEGKTTEKDGKVLYGFEQKNRFSVGDVIEVMKPSGENIELTVKNMFDEELNEIESCPHPGQVFYIDIDAELDEYDILRMKSRPL